MEGQPNITLIGYPVSNYFNITRAALIEKKLDHTILQRSAAQDDGFLALNPMGKIPVLQIDDNYIAETTAILEYLDDAYMMNSLRPGAAVAAARMRQIINIVQVYCEAPTRSLYPGVFMGEKWTDAQASSIKTTVDRAITALARLFSDSEFLVGEEISQADLFTYYNLHMVERVWQRVFDSSIWDQLPLSGWLSQMDNRESTRVVMASFEQCLGDYLADKGSDYPFKPRFIAIT